MDEKRVCDYFVVAGLPDNPLPLEEFSNEAIVKPNHKQDPITDIAVIIKSQGEPVPKGFSCVEKTPSGLQADLNHGSLRSPEIYLCYKRGRNKPPLTDIGVLYEGKELVMLGCEVVYMTPQGRPANVNNSTSSRTYITFRRADESAASDTLAVTEVCIILANKGETPPHAFCQIHKNLNKGIVGSDVFLCYKKSMVKTNMIAYNAGILSKYPMENYPEFPLPESVAMFCLPMGATIECWSSKSQHPLPVFSTFVLTGQSLDKVYGAAITFYEEYHVEKLTDLQRRLLGLGGPQVPNLYQTVHVNKSICVLSHWPFFDAFKKFLSFLYRISIVGPHTVPIERHISHFMNEVPFPSPQRPRILVQLNPESLSLSQPEQTPLPKSGASFIALLMSLGPEKCMDVLLLLLLEHKILVHSLRPALLTSAAEAISMMIFPFHWQCPYIPLCPLGLSDVLNAPCPFIVGVDSRFFDLYDPPPDVVCVDLDTSTIFHPSDRKAINYKMMPKRPCRVLKNTLTELYETLCDMSSTCSTPEVSPLDMGVEDHDFRRRRKELLMNIEVQEAFLRFMACIIQSYKQFLRPITKAPTLKATDASSLFDMEGFLRSREKTYHRFYNQMMRTQMFIRFIEERSFVSDKDASLVFFDECLEKVDENSDEPRLIELDDSHESEHTVLVTPPDSAGLPAGVKYSYNGFPELKPELFLHKATPRLLSGSNKSAAPGSPMAKRTKHEIKLAQRLAHEHSSSPHLWAKCLLGHAYSLWFIHLPSYVDSMHSKTKALHSAYDVLVTMQNSRLTAPEEVCYRVLMQLCGLYQQPALAVKVLFEMKRHGITPNAVTYGFYNKAVLESKWPSSTTNAYLLWRKLRNVVFGCARFRRAAFRRKKSTTTLTESDTGSRASIDSCLLDESGKQTEFVSDLVAVPAGGEIEQSTDVVSDQGYNSITREEAQQISDVIKVGNATTTSSTTDVSETSETDGESGVGNVMSKMVKAMANHVKPTSIMKRRVTVATFQPIDPCKDRPESPAEQFRARTGSIVRRNLSSAGSASSMGTLIGSTVGSSAGILMVDTRPLDNDVFEDPSTSKRKRHSSAGDHSKKISAMTSRRLRHSSGDPQVRSPRKKSEDGESAEGRSAEGEEGPNAADLPTEKCDSDGSTTPRNLRNGLAAIVAPPHELQFGEPDEPKTPTLPVIEETPNNIVRTPAAERDPLGLFEPGPKPAVVESTKCFDLMDLSLEDKQEEKDLLIDFCERPKDLDLGERARLQTISECSVGSSGSRKHTVSECSDRSDRSDTSVTENHAVSSPKLIQSPVRERTVSSPERVKTIASPKARSNTLQSPTSNKSMTRSDSFSEVLKFAASAMAKAGSKLTEIKQTIATPVKNALDNSLSNSLPRNHDTDDYSSSWGRRSNSDAGLIGAKSFLDEVDLMVEAAKSLPRSPGMKSSGSSPHLAMRENRSREKSPQPSQLRDFLPLKSIKLDLPPTLPTSLLNCAMEAEMTTCSRCFSCCSLLYDEEVMAGWSADDSNLNTSCPFCGSRLVPFLHIYIKDWRTQNRTIPITPGHSCESVYSTSSLPGPQPANHVTETTSTNHRPEATALSVDTADGCIQSKATVENLIDFSPKRMAGVKGVKGGAGVTGTPERIRCVSECTAVKPVIELQESIISNDDDERCAIVLDPIAVPYLSPLVLRKEMETVLDHDGDYCLGKPEFVDEHPIIYWNLIWYFKRLDVPSHLPGTMLRAKSTNKETDVTGKESWTSADSRHVLVRPCWDDVRLHDELGPPMYKLWKKPRVSRTVNALVTEQTLCPKNIMHQIVDCIRCNDLATPMKLVLNERLRSGKKGHFRSMYREILFLSFMACGRTDIDHDAFDREYRLAYQELSETETFLPCDKPQNNATQFARKVFCDLSF